MRNVMRAGALMMAATLMFAGTAWAAETMAKAELSGTMVGNTGGAFETWNVTLPKDTAVTLTLNHWPCNTGDAVGLEVWGPSGMMGQSHEKDACTQELAWTTMAAGPAEIKLYNYLDGVGTWWNLMATGVTLPGAMAPVMPAAKPAASTTTTTTAAAATTSTAATTTAATTTAATTTQPAAAAMATTAMKPAAAAMPAAGTLSVNNAVVYGDSAGAVKTYDLMVKKGTTYNATMDYASPNGGTWPGVGFKVWGPAGLVAESAMVDHDTASATFTAMGDDKYYIEVYNYHPGVPIFYALEVKPQ